MSPMLMANRSCSPRSIDTSGSGELPCQNAPSTIRSLASRLSRYVMVYSRPSEPRARTSSKLSSVRDAAADARDARPQHRQQLPRPGAVRRIGQERAHAVQPGPAARRAGTCRRDSSLTWIENSASRLACSDRTPTMKNAPRPTASRITRVWLPGRDRCSTACRSGNDGAFASGARSAHQQPAGQHAGRPPARRSRRHTTSPTRSDAACQAATATSAADTNTVAAIRRPVAAAAAALRPAAAARA